MAAGCPERTVPLRPKSSVPARAIPDTPYDRIQFTQDTVDAEHLNRMQTAIQRALQRTSTNADTSVRSVQSQVDAIVEHGGGAGGGGAVSVKDGQEYASSLGSEEIAFQEPVNLGGIGAAALFLRAAVFVSSDSGTATFKAYLGGTLGSINGTLIGSTTASSATLTAKEITGAVPNPGGVSIFTLTIRSSAVNVAGVARRFNGTLS